MPCEVTGTAGREGHMSEKKVVIVMGSPRKNGNSAALAEQVADGVRSTGGEAQVFRLHEMDIEPCDGCDVCQQGPGKDCHIKDDMQDIYTAIRQADALAIAGPVYWYSVTAQTKLFIDRCYAIAKPGDNALGRKPVGVVLVYGGGDAFSSGAVNALRMLQDAFQATGSRIVGMVHGSATSAGEVRADTGLMDRACDLGKRLVAEV